MAQDREDRIVEATNDTDWQFQFDNLFPHRLTKTNYLYLKKPITSIKQRDLV